MTNEEIKTLADGYYAGNADWLNKEQEQDTKVGWRQGFAYALRQFAVSGSFFNEVAIMEAAVTWCEFVGYDSKDEKVFNAFVMGAKLAISNDGWQNCH